MLPAILSLGISGLAFGALLGFAAIKLAVPVDERVTAIKDVLPGANCGACGLPGCGNLAEAIVAGKAAVDACPVGGSGTAAKIGEIMGVKADEREANVAVVLCQGSCDKVADRFRYDGPRDCASATLLQGGGQKACTYGCLGFGTCAASCPFDAIVMGDDRLPHIDLEKCTGCGQCVAACPKNIIILAPVSKQVYIRCRNHDRGPVVRKVCPVGCIACGLCVKNCPKQAISLDNNLAVIDYGKCTNCETCVGKCPTKAIASSVRHAEQQTA
ncbi:MAG: RnfABCDGE type electron transport complex subunit B [Bacillota bacterium]